MVGVTVGNVAPTITSLGGPTSAVLEGSPVTFAPTVSDPGGDPLTYLWNFGDNTTSTSATPTHTWADEGTGTYTVTLTVTDDAGATAQATTNVTVANAAPAITSISPPTNPTEGTGGTFSAVVTDPGTLDTHTYAWTFGDGGASTITGAWPPRPARGTVCSWLP